ncbi:hypothetical protein GCM10009837_71150 [Streptomyces durmitorensis]|uniref:PQQ-binding-like beta-propeller repeat protein n=1 Tax=Streptomyces durmitorensis TaxID=319947 RepID=A0ABY4PWP3_9ACTN|nr:PQQ-binding-like beta-propeller repeat protein [Streptomyces durmitorensis]UQT57378.1 PQQ-binding-like beta-propeller repeat protein [Streptomyces durmitorensis]
MGEARLWRPFLLGVAVTLAVAAAYPWWSGRTGDEFGTTSWWLRALPLLAAALLVAARLVPGVGRRRGTALAAGAAGSAALAGALLFVTWSRADEIAAGRREDRETEAATQWWWGATDRELHAVLTAWPEAAPLATALAAAVVAVAALLLAWRDRPWLDLDTYAEAADGNALRRRLRGGTACVLAGVLAGGLLSVASVDGAERIRDARTEALGPWWGDYAESEQVAASRLHKGSHEVRSSGYRPGAPTRPGRIAWQRGFDGPAALSTCAYEGRERGTLVVLEEGDRAARITGRDARDGSRRWSFSVRTSERVELVQVAVSEGCSVLVLMGSMLVSLDSYTGRERGATVLPMPGPKGWSFITSYRQPDALPRMVTLPDARVVHLASSGGGVVAVRRDGAEVLARSGGTGEGCAYLVDYASPDDSGSLLVEGCGWRNVLLTLPGSGPDPAYPPNEPDYRTPDLPLLFEVSDVEVTRPEGCEAGQVEWIRAQGYGADVAGTWRCGKGKSLKRTYATRRFVPSDSVARRDWERVPAARAPLHPAVELRDDVFATAVGDAVRIGWGLRERDRVHSEVPERGDRVAALDGSGGPWKQDANRDAVLALGASGLLTALEFRQERTEPPAEPDVRIDLRAKGSTTVARTPCTGTRDLLADPVSGTALVLCRDGEDRTRVTAVVDGQGFDPRR